MHIYIPTFQTLSTSTPRSWCWSCRKRRLPETATCRRQPHNIKPSTLLSVTMISIEQQISYRLDIYKKKKKEKKEKSASLAWHVHNNYITELCNLTYMAMFASGRQSNATHVNSIESPDLKHWFHQSHLRPRPSKLWFIAIGYKRYLLVAKVQTL